MLPGSEPGAGTLQQRRACGAARGKETLRACWLVTRMIMACPQRTRPRRPRRRRRRPRWPGRRSAAWEEEGTPPRRAARAAAAAGALYRFCNIHVIQYIVLTINFMIHFIRM